MAKVITEKVTMKELRTQVKAVLEQLNADAETNKKVTNKDAEFAVKAVAQVVADSLANGENVGIHGLGTWELRQRGSRAGRNPQTGEQITIEARKAVAFVPSASVKESVKK
jgi:DNA-binding protein HU-beta